MIGTVCDKIKKTVFAVIICVATIAVCLLVACASGNDDTPPIDEKTYSVVYKVNDENGGFIRGDAEQQIAEGGDGKMVTAVENVGYRFVGWSDGMTAETRRELNVTGEKCITAIFERNTYIIEYSAGQGGSITGDVKQKVQSGDNTDKVIAVPDVGYRFVKWSDGKTDAERTDVNVMQSYGFSAEFEFLYDGKGTQAEPYLISNYVGLCNSVYYPNSVFLLTADLDISSEVHEPIFTKYEFNGVFDGGGHTISGLNINRGTLYPSLFGRVGANGYIKDLSLTDVDIEAGLQGAEGETCVGAVASISCGKIENTTVGGAVRIGRSKGSFYIGGLVGHAQSGSIKKCVVTVDVEYAGSVSELYLGGIAGKGSNVEIGDCTVERLMLSGSSTDCNIGGLAAAFEKDIGIEISIHGNRISVFSNITVRNYGGLFVECHGEANDLLRIENCVVTNNAENCGTFAGFIVDADYVDIENCHVLNNEITACNNGAGFVLRSDYSFINGCGADGNIEATNRANGFCDKASYTEFTDCYSVGEFSGNVAAGFTWDILRGSASRCYSKGKVMPKVQGAGFAYIVRSTVSDCYSQCDVIVTNTDPDNEYSTYVGGFICRLGGSRLSNCYYSGSVRGSVYSLGAPGNFPREYFVGAFIGKTTGTNTIENCHVLHAEKGYATDVVANSVMSTGEPDIVVYNELQSMYELADILNGDRADVWKNVYNACPDLI